MAHGYADYVKDFINADEQALIADLVDAIHSSGNYDVNPEQTNAWHDEIALLKLQLKAPRFQDWYIVLEYEIPRRRRRPDVVILSKTTIFVIEFKVGSTVYDSKSRRQIYDCALDLRDFHIESRDRTIVPILCSTNAAQSSQDDPIGNAMGHQVEGLVTTHGGDLTDWLDRRNVQTGNAAAGSINPEIWLNSPYRPTTTIIEAARELYERNKVSDITHSFAHNLDDTMNLLTHEINLARTNSRHSIIFVTGVPGAGKTLVGLNAAHGKLTQGEDDIATIFLSGNEPLIKVVTGALVRSATSKGNDRHVEQRHVTTLIQNVHQYLRSHLAGQEVLPRKPYENVVIFDEGQRAWDARKVAKSERNRRSNNTPSIPPKWLNISEASLLFEVMEQKKDWATIIVLVGAGQEIYEGEAGLAEWGKTLQERPIAWRIVASPEALKGGESVSGHRLFLGNEPSADAEIQESDEAHLDVVVRSYRAQQWAEWVNALLDSRISRARDIFPDVREFPCVITRDLDSARFWLQVHRDRQNDDRTGLVATTADERLRAYGIERSNAFRKGFDFVKWFLEADSRTRSSNRLEVAASEFECQGLELDWVGLCWGGDLIPTEDRSDWKYRRFRRDQWQTVHQEREQAYTRNRYRVLLTRARKGMVIWVPSGEPGDSTRDPEEYDRVFTTLTAAGVPVLKDSFENIELDGIVDRRLLVVFERQSNGYVASCPDTDMATYGATMDEARENLRDALKTLDPTVQSTEVQHRLF